VDLLVEQVEFANVIILNKMDRIAPSHVGAVEAIIRKLNPDAKIIRSEFSRVSPAEILDTKRFSPISLRHRAKSKPLIGRISRGL
jgi:G3E family GTPase